MKETKKNVKTKEEILNQTYLSPQDLKDLMPTMGIDRCRNYISLVRNEMEQKGYYVPQTKPRLALTKLVRKKFGI